jgi:hypothetical protein
MSKAMLKVSVSLLPLVSARPALAEPIHVPGSGGGGAAGGCANATVDERSSAAAVIAAAIDGLVSCVDDTPTS